MNELEQLAIDTDTKAKAVLFHEHEWRDIKWRAANFRPALIFCFLLSIFGAGLIAWEHYASEASIRELLVPVNHTAHQNVNNEFIVVYPGESWFYDGSGYRVMILNDDDKDELHFKFEVKR